jgi:hypothetical protein
MRFVVGLTLLDSAAPRLFAFPFNTTAVESVLLATAGVFLIVGLYTPIVGIVVALAEISDLVIEPAGKLVCLLLATLGAALAMLGPGLWSIDARLFGWRRIEPTPRNR